jgi:hypothetical protein
MNERLGRGLASAVALGLILWAALIALVWWLA